MDRRDFMKLTALTGLALAAPFGVKRAQAQSEDPYTGLFFIAVDAGGGWDPTSAMDPKGYTGASAPQAGDTNEMNKLYSMADAQNRANWGGGVIPYAPYFGRTVNGAVVAGYPGGTQVTTQIQSGTVETARGAEHDSFFTKHASRLLVINGIDVKTNDHMGGSRNSWSGKLGEGHPAVAALFASSVARTKPMAFISQGGYDLTSGTVAVTRAGNINLLTNLARPTYTNSTQENSARYLSDETDTRLLRFQRERTLAAIEGQRLPRWRAALNTLYTVREGNNELTRVMEILNGNLPGTQTKLIDSLQTLNNNGAQQQVRLAIGAYRAGIAASLSVATGGFDTHQDHDQIQIPSLRNIMNLVDFIYEEAVNVQGVPMEKIVIMVGSDFGRTPGYNASNGKDHWSITSQMFMGGGIRGGRVIGASDERHRGLPVDPATLAPQPRDSTSGVTITPAHVHLALRKHLGINDGERSREFAIDAVTEDLPLFT